MSNRDIDAGDVEVILGDNVAKSVTVEAGEETVLDVEAPYYSGGGGSVPVISVEANSLPAGSDATATISGNPDKPLITFGIPRGDKGEQGEKGDPGTTTWAGITDKPSEFPPSAHTHTKSQITDFAHTHEISEVTDLQDALDGKANISHTHTTAQVTELDAALAGKAPIIHTHEIGDVDGLETALAGKQPVGSYATTADIADMLTKTEAGQTYATKADTYTKAEVDQNFSSTFKYQGSVDTYDDLPTTKNKVGNVWQGNDVQLSYAWNGKEWKQYGFGIDFTAYQTIVQADAKYATNTALSSGLAGKVSVSVYEAKIQALEARISALEKAGYITAADLPTPADFVE